MQSHLMTIYTIIKSCKIYKIGRLAIYDTAIRIAYLKGLEPTEVYLQQGASWGAHKLCIHGKSVNRDKFDDLGLKDFKIHEIECFLCIYHKCFDCLYIDSCPYIVTPTLFPTKKGICKR